MKKIVNQPKNHETFYLIFKIFTLMSAHRRTRYLQNRCSSIRDRLLYSYKFRILYSGRQTNGQKIQITDN